MTVIRHCIIDTTTNTVVNIIDYETTQNGVPPGLASHLICVPSTTGQIGGSYANGVITNTVWYTANTTTTTASA